MSRCWSLFAALAVGALAACAPPPVYQVQRAALVQPPTPPLWAGRVRDSGLSLGDSTVLWHNRPRRAPDSLSGLYVARTQFEGLPHFRLGPNLALWLPMAYGPASGALEAVPGLVRAPDRGALSGGIGLAGSTRLGERLSLGASFEGQLASVPSRMLATCIEHCEGAAPTITKQEGSLVPMMRASLLLSVDLGRVRLFAGVSARNQPTNQRRSQLVVEDGADDIDAAVEPGPLYVMPGAGLEVDLGGDVSLLAYAYQPLPADTPDLLYGPVAGLALEVH